MYISNQTFFFLRSWFKIAQINILIFAETTIFFRGDRLLLIDDNFSESKIILCSINIFHNLLQGSCNYSTRTSSVWQLLVLIMWQSVSHVNIYSSDSIFLPSFPVTEEGLFTMPEIKQHLFCPGPAIQITKGKFEGLAVMEPYSEEPVILTTRKLHGVVLVCMIGR